jgi:hypothetical protein
VPVEISDRENDGRTLITKILWPTCKVILGASLA